MIFYIFEVLLILLILVFIISSFVFMIQPQTYLVVADNTGAKKIMCIHILGSNRRFAYLGDILIGVVKL